MANSDSDADFSELADLIEADLNESNSNEVISDITGGSENSDSEPLETEANEEEITSNEFEPEIRFGITKTCFKDDLMQVSYSRIGELIN